MTPEVVMSEITKGLEMALVLGAPPLLAVLEKAGVPASPINTIGEMFDDPQVIARGLRLDLTDAAGTDIPSVRAPMRFSATPLAYERPSPRLGEHTREVLAELEAEEEAVR